MGRTRLIVIAVVAASALAAGSLAVAAASDPPARAVLPADGIEVGSGLGRSWYLGGFSDLHPEGASGKEFWTLTDRGPNLDAGVGGAPCQVGAKVYPLASFAPEIVRTSVVHVAADGTVLTRLVPGGTEDTVAGAGAGVVAVFPETIRTNFRPNRGFEESRSRRTG